MDYLTKYGTLMDKPHVREIMRQKNAEPEIKDVPVQDETLRPPGNRSQEGQQCGFDIRRRHAKMRIADHVARSWEHERSLAGGYSLYKRRGSIHTSSDMLPITEA